MIQPEIVPFSQVFSWWSGYGAGVPSCYGGNWQGIVLVRNRTGTASKWYGIELAWNLTGDWLGIEL